MYFFSALCGKRTVEFHPQFLNDHVLPEVFRKWVFKLNIPLNVSSLKPELASFSAWDYIHPGLLFVESEAFGTWNCLQDAMCYHVLH